MRYRLGIGFAIGTAVMVSAWGGYGEDFDHAAAPQSQSTVSAKAAAIDLDLATVYRQRPRTTPAPIWESRMLSEDADSDRPLAPVASLGITPPNRTPVFARQRR